MTNSNKEKKTKRFWTACLGNRPMKILLAGIFIVSFLGQTGFSKTYFWSDISVAPVMDDNVYKDSKNYKDTGYKGSFNLGARSKLSRTTFGRFQYRLDLSAFPEYNLQNTTSHSFEAILKQRLGDMFGMDLDAGFNLSQMPKAEIYNSDKLSLLPVLKWHVFDHTTIGCGYIYEKTRYPKYNLDNQATGLRLKFTQEFSLYTDLDVSGVLKTKKYSEQQLLSGVVAGTPTYKTDKREDDEKFIEISLLHNIDSKTGFGLSYYLGRVDSNGNYLDWGPNQYESKNTTVGDERIIANYRSYTSGRYGVNCFTSFIGDSNVYLLASYGTTDYPGRLAKNENDAIRTPDTKRQDKQTFFSVGWSKSIVSLRYSYENNKSNDALYDYVNNVVSLNIRYLFRLN